MLTQETATPTSNAELLLKFQSTITILMINEAQNSPNIETVEEHELLICGKTLITISSTWPRNT